MEVVVTTGAIRCAEIQSNHHHQQTTTQLFTGRMPFLSPNQECQSIEGKISHSMDLLTPTSSGWSTNCQTSRVKALKGKTKDHSFYTSLE